MATEYKLPYTAAQIEEKLDKIDAMEADIKELSGGNVAYDTAQNLTEEQKTQARENIGAVSADSTDLTDEEYAALVALLEEE